MVHLDMDQENDNVSCFGRWFTQWSFASERNVRGPAYQYVSAPSTEVLPPAYDDCIATTPWPMDEKQDNVTRRTVKHAIAAISDELHAISLDLHDHPELSLKEYHAHDILTDYLERKGFKVTRQAHGMETAFVAEYSRGTGRRVGVCCEYDGLPGLGQGCGHNLIAISALATALGVKAALDQGEVAGKIVVFGTPAEESTVGKIRMVQQEVFQNSVDVCVMVHPANYDAQYARMIAVNEVRVEFGGKETHASASPWEGVNALDAMVQTWNNISMLRQQLRPTDRVHGIVTEGGKAPNVIPGRTEARFYARTTTLAELGQLQAKVERCFEAGAMATGCKVTWAWKDIGPVADVLQNCVMADAYARYMEDEGVQFAPRHEQDAKGGGSTDMGNVSYVVPSIHPFYNIHTDAVNHTVAFTEAARTPQAHEDTLRASTAQALVAVQVLRDESFYQAARREFDMSKVNVQK